MGVVFDTEYGRALATDALSAHIFLDQIGVPIADQSTGNIMYLTKRIQYALKENYIMTEQSKPVEGTVGEIMPTTELPAKNVKLFGGLSFGRSAIWVVFLITAIYFVLPIFGVKVDPPAALMTTFYSLMGYEFTKKLPFVNSKRNMLKAALTGQPLLKPIGAVGSTPENKDDDLS